MIIGVDFDNTIVCYDQLFHAIALEKGLIPGTIDVSKTAVRDYLRKIGNEDAWTEMQGYVYGARMSEALPYAKVKSFFKEMIVAGHELRIISHKTKYPYRGEKYDLHAAALKWIEEQGFLDNSETGLKIENVFFNQTKEEKLTRIAEQGCEYFIDDLPELLKQNEFPNSVSPILFDPNSSHMEELKTFSRWIDIIEYFRYFELKKKVVVLIPNAAKPDILLEPVACGGNNRVYRVDIEAKKYLLKSYFTHQNDLRDRLGNEYSFLEYACHSGVSAVPNPVGCDKHNSLAIYEFVYGDSFNSIAISEADVSRAADFFIDINRCRYSELGKKLNNASEACFSIQEHVDCVDRRIKRLLTLGGSTNIYKEVKAFVTDHLLPMWNNVRRDIEQNNNALDEVIDDNQRCISPSDFGFHNAIKIDDGSIKFIDFEYAGWDDPAKMICDFFSQPAIPVEEVFFKSFTDKISAEFDHTIVTRAELLMPLYRIKWCCIMMNEFHVIDGERRTFAGKNSCDKELGKQFELVKTYFNRFFD